ncbi:MAG: hypothetical protein LBL07_16405 [Tannerella sp.]|nr:hypothetical protein [Tannerella sp.]
MKKIFSAAFYLWWMLGNQAAAAELKSMDGFPAANFALTVNASENGDFYGLILQNTGKLGGWLNSRGGVSFQVEKDGRRHSFAGFKQKNIRRSFPFVENTYQGSPLTKARIEVQTFCPLSVNDVALSSLPVLLLEISALAAHDESFNLLIMPDSLLGKDLQACKSSGYSGAGSKIFQITGNAETRWENGTLRLPVALKAGEKKKLHILLTFYDADWISAKQFGEIGDITQYAYTMRDMLKEKTRLFSDAIPVTGDKELDRFLRWYMIPGISLTRCTRQDEILTMGYCELNQRDSYWTTWLHLVLFKDAERKMIEESIHYQQASGKIPTTILPLIERNDDLDINAFFILRAARYFKYYHDLSALAAHWPALCRAMDWLLSRDASGDGLPVQVSFWGDWKDVRGIEGRKYSPFSGLVYLAALKEMISLSNECQDDRSREKYEAAYRKGYDFINRPVEEGGLWNGSYYCQLWNGGIVNDKLLQDQTIGILFDVIPRDRAEKIIESLNAKSMTPYGIAETWPSYPADFGYKPATYHNGAVWPWLSFMDCWARIRAGRSREAVDLVKKVAAADLVNSGDWSPNEHINSLTGENLGFQLQGWNAGLFGLVYFGIVHKDCMNIP